MAEQRRRRPKETQRQRALPNQPVETSQQRSEWDDDEYWELHQRRVLAAGEAAGRRSSGGQRKVGLSLAEAQLKVEQEDRDSARLRPSDEGPVRVGLAGVESLQREYPDIEEEGSEPEGELARSETMSGDRRVVDVRKTSAGRKRPSMNLDHLRIDTEVFALDLKLGARLLLATLLVRERTGRPIRPGQVALCDFLNVSRSTITRANKELVSKGYVSYQTKGARNRGIYELKWHPQSWKGDVAR